MPFPPTLSPLALETFIDMLAPIVESAAGDEPGAARNLALELLAEYQPHNTMELLTACQAIAFKVTEVNVQMEALEPGLTVGRSEDLRKLLKQLARGSLSAQRSLQRIQRRRTGAPPRPRSSRPRPNP